MKKTPVLISTRVLAIFISIFSVIQSTNAQKLPQLGKKSEKQVIAKMTLEEKVRLLVGMGMKMPAPPPPKNKPPATPTTTPTNQGPVIGATDDKVPGAAGTTAKIDRFGIPQIVVADGPAGLRIQPNRANETKTYYATAFPIATLLSSTWNTELIYKTGEAMGNEVKEYGVDVILGPGMNIHRNPLGGRNFEYYSEDPLLTGKVASAMVRGIQSNGVGTSIKHFAVNNHETNRNTIEVHVSQRALREIYLRGFEIAIKEAKPWTVMSSYNLLNGTYTSESSDLLQKVLRQDWGYKGLVMTDWFGGKDAVAQMKAGNELLMPGTPRQTDSIIAAVKRGELSEKVLDANLEKLLNIVKETQSFKGYKFTSQPNLVAHAAIARQSATEGMILLKNDSESLPINLAMISDGKHPMEGVGTAPATNNQIAAFGDHSYDLISGGTGSGDVNEAYTVSLIEGLKNAGFTLDDNIANAYQKYLESENAKIPKGRPFFLPAIIFPEFAPTDSLCKLAAENNNLAIITIGRIAGEFADRKIKDDYYLSDIEQEMIAKVSTAFHAKGKKVIVVLNVGGVIETASWRDKADAILLTWLPGQEAGNAIADILTGKVNPSGKLPTTFLTKYEDDPTAATFPGKEKGPEIILLGFMKVHAADIDYTEGIYVGYRAFDKQNIKPAYEFGYGMSYTTFEYSNLQLSANKFKDKITVSVTIKNTGKTAGKEVAQLYLTAPSANLDKPLQELKGFEKTRTLQPNESQTITFVLDKRSLASFDEKTSAWIAEKGDYNIKIGASSRNIKLKADFNLSSNIEVEKVSNALPIK
jgi:beta-glucosidase